MLNETIGTSLRHIDGEIFTRNSIKFTRNSIDGEIFTRKHKS